MGLFKLILPGFVILDEPQLMMAREVITSPGRCRVCFLTVSLPLT